MGASRTINRIYKLVLTLSVVIQLSLFFVVSAVALWLDQLTHGAIAVMATQSAVYQAFLMVVVVVGFRFSSHDVDSFDTFLVTSSLAFDGMSVLMSFSLVSANVICRAGLPQGRS